MDASDIGCQPGASELNNVIAFLELHRLAAPDRIALQWLRSPGEWKGGADALPPHESMTHGELSARVESVAAGLAKLGLSFGDRVFIFIPMSPELYLAMFAVQRLGAIAVFLDSWARRDQLGSCAAQVEPKGFIGPEPAFALTVGVPELEGAPIRVVVGPHSGSYSAELGELAAGGGSSEIAAVEPEHTALVTFTTGSSGPPKGADRTHRFLAAQHRALDRCLPYAADDVDLPVFPIFSLNNLAGGVTTVLPAVDLAKPAATDGELLAAQIRAMGATSCTLSPSLLRGVSAAAGRAGAELAGLRRAATGGAPISTDDIAAFRTAAPNAELHVLYGSTEVEPIAHLVIDKPFTPSTLGTEGVCVGEIAEGLEVRFVRLSRGPIELGPRGWAEWEVPAGEFGELVVSGEHVCRDYYRNPEAFRAAKIVDVGGQVWHRTGDVCRLDYAWQLWVAGRVHNAICRDGRTLLPVTPEIVMKRLPFVEAAAYLGLPDEKLGERAAAVFSVKLGAAPGDFEVEVRKALAAADVVVDDVIRVDAIPLDPRHHSKVEYGKLREQILAGQAGEQA